MRSRWSEDEAGRLEGVDLLVYASRLIGAEPSLVVWGGGNTSLKVAEPDYRGRSARVLRVKGSGSDLKSVQKKDFPGVRMDDIEALLDREDMGDEEMVAYLAHALQEVGGARPSIETLLHGFLATEAVIHTHADAVVSLTNNDRAQEVIASVYGRSVVSLAYRRPGFRISKEVAESVRAHPEARALILEKHGTLTWGRTIREAYEATVGLINLAEEAIAARKRGRPAYGGPRVPVPAPVERRRIAVALAPRLRGLIGRSILSFDDDTDVLEFVSSAQAAELSQVGPATPDHTIYTKRLPCYVPADRADDPDQLMPVVTRAVEQFARGYAAYFERHAPPGLSLADPMPRVVLVPGLGMFTTGRDKRTAGIVDDIYRHTIAVLGSAAAFGQYVSLSPKEAFDIEYWPLELYKLTLAPPEKELARRVALVTGGASGIARAALRLMKAQARGGALVFVATKNVMSPGKDFAAYSASKAAEAQLAKVLALEGGPVGVRSNIVNPDAVFQDSKLWSEELRRERAAAQGISVAELEDYYRKRNLLGAPILPEDVAEAIVFLASDRASKTTGCTLTVDGGVKDAFPR